MRRIGWVGEGGGEKRKKLVMCKGKDQKEKDDYSVRTTQPLIRRSSQPTSTSEYFEAASRTAVGEEVKKERRKKKKKESSGCLVQWFTDILNSAITSISDAMLAYKLCLPSPFVSACACLNY